MIDGVIIVLVVSFFVIISALVLLVALELVALCGSNS